MWKIDPRNTWNVSNQPVLVKKCKIDRNKEWNWSKCLWHNLHFRHWVGINFYLQSFFLFFFYKLKTATTVQKEKRNFIKRGPTWEEVASNIPIFKVLGWTTQKEYFLFLKKDEHCQFWISILSNNGSGSINKSNIFESIWVFYSTSIAPEWMVMQSMNTSWGEAL